jgi:hypothetical protein
MAVADFADAPRPMDRGARLVGTRIETGVGHPLRGREIIREHQELGQQAHRRGFADVFGRDQMGELGGQCGHATNQFQTAVVHALEAPLQVADIDLDVVRDRIGTGPAKLRSMAAILLPRELGVELHDAAVNRLQLQDLRGRGCPAVTGMRSR